MFLLLWSLTLCFADLNEIWKQAGCTNSGILSPIKTNSFWKRRNDQQQIINAITKGVEARDSLSLFSCRGKDARYLDPDRGQSITIHLLWECYEKDKPCQIPFVHSLCIQTLRQVHPKATIILWSNTIDEIEDESMELRPYDWETFFADLPDNVLNAARTMQSYFSSHQNSRSHFSDLFRAAVLYKYGGYYSDLDSIWLRDIGLISDSPSWVPITPAWKVLGDKDRIEINGKQYFLEGGIMKMEKGSPFLKAVLESFPEYSEKLVECWECVGPRLLTQTYNQMKETNPGDLPEFIDSQRVYGVPHYRNYFPNMFQEFDPDVWLEFVQSDTVAAHLFTSSLQPTIKESSILSLLFSVGGLPDVSTKQSATWRKSVSERRNLLSSLYYVNDENMGSAQIGGGSVIYWVGELEPVQAEVVLSEMTDENIETVRNIFYESYPDVVLSAVVIEQIDAVTLKVTVNEPDYYNVVSQSIDVGMQLQLNRDFQAVITTMTIPEIGGGRATVVAECTASTAVDSATALSTISTSIATHIGIDEEDLEMTTSFSTSAGAFCRNLDFTSSLTDAEKVSAVHNALSIALGVSSDMITVQEPNALGNFLFSVETSSFDEASVIDTSLGSASTESSVNDNLNLSENDRCQLLTGTGNIVSTTTVVADTTGTTYTTLNAQVASAQADIEAVFDGETCEVTSTSAYVHGANAVGSCDLLGECTADYQEIVDDLNADLGLVKAAEVTDLNQWWQARLAEYPVPNYEQVKVYNGFFAVPCTTCNDPDMYVNTCVQFNENMQDACDSSIGFCAGDPVEVYGWSGQQAAALLKAMEMPQKQHPYCPYGCQKLNDWWLGELDARFSDSNKANLDILCVQDNKYYLYPDPQTKTDTCVGYHESFNELCPLSSYVFCSSTDDGMVTYGWVGQQARALEVALSTSLSRHPHCS